MKRTFVLSVLALFLALGAAWSAPGSASGEQQLRDMEAQILGPAAGSVPAASCTVQCWPDPYNPGAPPLSCTSATGNCSSGGKGTFFYIMCDGNMIVCPEYW